MVRYCFNALVVVASVGISAPVWSQTVSAQADSGTGDAGVSSRPILSVTANDLVNGAPATLGASGNATISTVGRWQGGIQLNTSNGAVTAAAIVPAGQYVSQYKLCDRSTPADCVNGSVTVTLAVAAIHPVPDSGTATAGIAAQPIANVAANDLIDGAPAVLGSGGNATVARSGAWPSGIALTTTSGAITTTASAPAGPYSLPYTLCDRNLVPVCATVTDSVTISSPVTGPPTATSIAAAKATSQNNALCTALQPYYLEIGIKDSALLSVSQGTGPGGTTITASTLMDIASASKWLYASYVVQLRGGVQNLTAADIAALTMTDGYANMGAESPVGECPPTESPTINVCLTQVNAGNGLPFSYQNPADVGFFDYDAGHFENHASQYTGLGNLILPQLSTTITTELGPSVRINYTQPIPAGSGRTTPIQYINFLQNILSGTLLMRDALGTNLVCTSTSPPCNAIYTPLDGTWGYSIGHWVENDTAVGDDGSFSNVGAMGFYAWIDPSKNYYGVVARASNAGNRQGNLSAQCGAAIRSAWETGVETTATTKPHQ